MGGLSTDPSQYGTPNAAFGTANAVGSTKQSQDDILGEIMSIDGSLDPTEQLELDEIWLDNLRAKCAAALKQQKCSCGCGQKVAECTCPASCSCRQKDGSCYGLKKEAAAKPGLWANINAKRKRGEKPAKPGDKDYPDAKSWEKTVKSSGFKAAFDFSPFTNNFQDISPLGGALLYGDPESARFLSVLPLLGAAAGGAYGAYRAPKGKKLKHGLIGAGVGGGIGVGGSLLGSALAVPANRFAKTLSPARQNLLRAYQKEEAAYQKQEAAAQRAYANNFGELPPGLKIMPRDDYIPDDIRHDIRREISEAARERRNAYDEVDRVGSLGYGVGMFGGGGLGTLAGLYAAKRYVDKKDKDKDKTEKQAAAKPGLWANIHAKRKRGEKPAKPGDKDYPDSKSWTKTVKSSGLFDFLKSQPEADDWAPPPMPKSNWQDEDYDDEAYDKQYAQWEKDLRRYLKTKGYSQIKQHYYEPGGTPLSMRGRDGKYHEIWYPEDDEPIHKPVALEDIYDSGDPKQVYRSGPGLVLVGPKRAASSPAWQRSAGKNDEGGLNEKGRKSYEREHGGNLKAPVTESKPSGERAKRQNSFCSRMCGMKRVNTGAKTKSDPDSRINKSLRKWNCKCGSALEFGLKLGSLLHYS
jgi:hypothetical protein